MNVIRTDIPEVLLFEPKVFGDERGFFLESYNKRVFRDVAGLDIEFVQDNHSRSQRGVLRGLHYQIKQTQGKLVRAVSGEIYDVAVDIRKSSATFGRWVGMMLSSANRRMAWVPPGFAHGFVVMSETAEVLYKASDFYAPEHERSIRWDDPGLAIDWKFPGEPLVSAKDREGALIGQAILFD